MTRGRWSRRDKSRRDAATCLWCVFFVLTVATYFPGTGAAIPPPPAPVQHAVIVPECPTEQLAQYRVELNTYWTNETFPKHYPQWRPHAQWTKLLGMSHSPQHVVFREGERASPAVKQFVETGRSDQLDGITYESQGTLVLDAFAAPAIDRGDGTTQANFFADGNHSRVTLIAKIVPSPDWFIGVDSLQLCSAGHWLNATSIQLSPMDAGTDQGLAFTSPSWQLSPPDPITRITHNFPSHPAASFAYPEKSSLPKLASLSIVKVREYRLVKPLSSKVPLRVYDSPKAVDVEADTAYKTDLIYHQHQQDSRHDTERELWQGIQHLNDKASRDSSAPASDHSFDHHPSKNSIQTLSNQPVEFPAINSNDLPSQDHPHIDANEITRTHPSFAISRNSLDGALDSNQIHPSLVTSSHGAPSNRFVAGVPHSYPNRLSEIEDDSILITNEVSALHGDYHENQNSNALNHDRSLDHHDESHGDHFDPSRDLPYNEVLPREQYDRRRSEELQERRRQEALLHHHRQQQEKRRRLKEKKRKHRERKLIQTSSRDEEKEEEVDEPGIDISSHRQYKSSSLRVIPKGDAMSVIDNIVETYQREQRRKRRQQRREERKQRRLLSKLKGVPMPRDKKAVDCVVGDWSNWSPCSKTCGIGEQVRVREITTHPRRGGTKCPRVKETTWCGSARDCRREVYFRW